MDIPMIGMKVIWYKQNGSMKSIIDRVLVSKDWLEIWPNSKQFVSSRSVLDHCALVLKDKCSDWGPKSFRGLDIWQKDDRFNEFVRDK